MSDTYYPNYTVQPGQTLIIPGAGSYVSGPNQGHFSGTTTNEGTIEVEANDNPEGGEAAYTVDVGNDTLTGGGNVVLVTTGTTTNPPNSASINVDDVFDNVNNVISGFGTIQGVGSGSRTFINEAGGTVDANDSTGGNRPLQVLEISVVNAGTLEASGEGDLQLFDVALNNVGGTIAANGPNARVDLDGTTVTGGTLQGTDGGVFTESGTGLANGGFGGFANGATLNGVAISSGTTFEVLSAPSSALDLQGAIANAGIITVNPGGFSSYNGSPGTIEVTGSVSLTGGGTIEMDGAGNGANFSIDANGSLDNVNNIISGSGQITAGTNATLINESGGTIDASDGTNQLGLSGVVTNGGLIEATGAGGLRLLYATIANAGGTIAANGGDTFLDQATITGGTLSSTNGGVFVARNGFAGNGAIGGSTLDNVTLASGTTMDVTAQYSGPTFEDTTTVAGAATITGTAIANNGTIVTTGTAAGGSSNDVVLDTSVSGTGTITIGGDSTLELGGQVTGQTINFANTQTTGTETLQIDSTNPSGDIQATIAGFGANDAIDLANLSGATGYTYDGSTLTVNFASGATANLSVSGLNPQTAFSLNANGNGTVITETAAPPAPAAPSVAFDPTTAGFVNGVTPVLTGEVSAQAGVAGVEIYDGDPTNGGQDLGAATVNGDGTWTFQGNIGAGDFSGLTAVATDGLGQTTTATAPYELLTGVTGEPYRAIEYDFSSDGSYGYTEYGRFGAPLVGASDNGDGTHTIQGSGRDGQSFYSVADDTITGYGNRENFVFTPGFGHDEVTDFQAFGPGHDTVDLSNTHFTSFVQVLQHTTMSDGSATIHFNPHDSVTLDGVTKAAIAAHPRDFLLA